MLEVTGLKKVYASGAGPLEVLRGIDLRLEAGAALSVTGPSGAGKSTLLHLMAGLDTPTAGDVRWEGESLAGMSEAARARFRNGTIGVVFQFYHLVPELTALENVMLPGLLGGRPSRSVRDQALASLHQVGLEPRAGHKPRALSGGEMQRAAVARALVNDPRLLLCDEPTGNLDSANGGAIIDLLMRLHGKRRMGLVIVTHDERLAARAGRTIRLRDGRLDPTERAEDAPHHR